MSRDRIKNPLASEISLVPAAQYQEASTVEPDNAPDSQERLNRQIRQWEKEFQKNVGNSVTARNAWREIRIAGLATVAEAMLFQYAERGRVFERHLRELKHLTWCEKATQRSVQVAEERLRRSDPRTSMFERRANEKVQSFLGAIQRHPMIHQKWAKRRRPKSGSTARLIYAAQREKLMHVLVGLRHLAVRRDVKLGLGRLLALTDCASPNTALLHRGTLARVLRRRTTSELRNLLREYERLFKQLLKPTP